MAVTRLHEELKVVGVVKDLLGLLADVEDGFHHCYRVAPPQCLSSQEDAVYAVQHSIGDIRRLSPAGMQGSFRCRSPNSAASGTPDVLFLLSSTALAMSDASALQTCSYP